MRRENEARKRTRLNRKVLIRKLAHPAKPNPGKRGPRRATYGAEVVTALVKVWEIFDYPCGQRLASAVREQLDRLRRANEIRCSEEVAGKLKRVSPKTMDRLLAREKRVRGLRQNRNPEVSFCIRSRRPTSPPVGGECEGILRRTQEATRDGMDRMRKRLPFRILEIHPDNDTGMINNLM
jgi:hypothetical protein